MRETMRKLKGLLFGLCVLFAMLLVGRAQVSAATMTMTIERFSIGGRFIMEPTVVEFTPGETYAKLLTRVLNDNGYTYSATDTQYGFYLQGIDNVDVGISNMPACVNNILKDRYIAIIGNSSHLGGLYERSYTSGSGWMYSVNDRFPSVGMDYQSPKQGDVARFMFTLYMGADLTGVLRNSSTNEVEKTYYISADKTELIRLMGTINQDHTKYAAMNGFSDAWAEAVAVMVQMDAKANDVKQAISYLQDVIFDNVPIVTPEPEPTVIPEPTSVPVPVKPSAITLNRAALEMSVGDTAQQLTYTISPSGAQGTVIWSSGNVKVAKVDAKGKVTPVSAGETDIKVTTDNGKMASCHVKVTESLKSSFVSGIPKVTAKAVSATSVKVQWNAYENAEKYLVYRREAGKGSFTRLTTVTGLSYTDAAVKANTSYYYTVKAASEKWGSEVYSQYDKNVLVQTPTPKKPAKPSLTVKAGKKQAVLAWKKVSLASGYQVYRASSKNGKYSLVTTIKKGNTVFYTNKKLKTGKTYYYKVRAYRTVSGKKVYGAYSSVKAVKIK